MEYSFYHIIAENSRLLYVWFYSPPLGVPKNKHSSSSVVHSIIIHKVYRRSCLIICGFIFLFLAGQLIVFYYRAFHRNPLGLLKGYAPFLGDCTIVLSSNIRYTILLLLCKVLRVIFLLINLNCFYIISIPFLLNSFPSVTGRANCICIIVLCGFEWQHCSKLFSLSSYISPHIFAFMLLSTWKVWAGLWSCWFTGPSRE